MNGRYSDILLVTDMDGTLLTRQCAVTNENQKTIHRFQEEGGLFTIASGRAPSTLRCFANALDVRIPVICQNGSILYDYRQDKSVITYHLDEGALPIVREVMDKYPDAGIEIHTDKQVYHGHPNRETAIRLSLEWIDVLPFTDPAEIPQPWLKVGFWRTAERLNEFFSFVSHLNVGRFSYLRTHEFCTELLNLKADKGILLQELRRLYPTRRIVSCGDNENDVLMLKNADISFAPINAFPCAKEAAGTVLDEDCDHSFIAAVINRL